METRRKIVFPDLSLDQHTALVNLDPLLGIAYTKLEYRKRKGIVSDKPPLGYEHFFSSYMDEDYLVTMKEIDQSLYEQARYEFECRKAAQELKGETMEDYYTKRRKEGEEAVKQRDDERKKYAKVDKTETKKLYKNPLFIGAFIILLLLFIKGSNNTADIIGSFVATALFFFVTAFVVEKVREANPYGLPDMPKGIIIKIVIGICLLLLIKFALAFLISVLPTSIKLFAVYCIYLAVCIGLTWLFVRYSTSIVRAINLKATPLFMFFFFIFLSFKFGIYMYEEIDHQTPNAYFILMSIFPFVFFAICGYNHTIAGKRVEEEAEQQEIEEKKQAIVDAYNPKQWASQDDINKAFE